MLRNTKYVKVPKSCKLLFSNITLINILCKIIDMNIILSFSFITMNMALKLWKKGDLGMKDLLGLVAFSFENGRKLLSFENDKNLTMCKEFDFEI